MMPGFKNVMFGGEGLFITTLTGPGTVWLQGMPPDRMISEIARRVPSGSGIGLGIPIGMGGGGSSSGGVVEGEQEEIANGVEGSEDLVASTDAAVEADRNATIASSGFSSTDGGDSESSSALFGDVAPSSPSTSAVSQIDSNNSQDNFSSDFGADSSFSNDSPSMPDLKDDSTSFSTEENADFGEDLTNKQFEEFQQDETSFSSESGQSPDIGNSEEGGSSIINTLWDLFFHDDNDE